MAKTKMKKGERLVCVPCGREVLVDCCGMSTTTLWCCGSPMKKSSSVLKKKATKK